jgi:hypothetical protein
MNMMNLLIFFIYIQLNFGKINNEEEEEEKYIFKCMDLYDSRCVSLDKDESTTTIMIGDICPYDMVCESICVKKYNELFIGSKCNYNQECFSNKCDNNICVADDYCIDDFGCNPGFYCNETENKCQKMGQKIEFCTHKIK